MLGTSKIPLGLNNIKNNFFDFGPWTWSWYRVESRNQWSGLSSKFILSVLNGNPALTTLGNAQGLAVGNKSRAVAGDTGFDNGGSGVGFCYSLALKACCSLFASLLLCDLPWETFIPPRWRGQCRTKGITPPLCSQVNQRFFLELLIGAWRNYAVVALRGSWWLMPLISAKADPRLHRETL